MNRFHAKRAVRPSASVIGAIGILAMAVFCLLPVVHGEDAVEDPVFLDMGMTVHALGDVGANDAVAAFATYARGYAVSQGLSVVVEANVFDGLAELRRAMVDGRIRITGLQIQEYLDLREHVPLDLLFKAEKSGTTTERYVILVRSDSDVTDLSSLRNGDFRILAGTHMGLARIWLDTLLLEAGLTASDEFFRETLEEKTTSLIVLPVFFNKADACLVNHLAFQTMVELNPQVGRQLRVLYESPDLVPFVTCMRRDFTGRHRELTEDAYLNAHLHPRGRQALMLFRYDRLFPCSEEDLSSARMLIAGYERLRERSSASGHVNSGVK